MGLFDLFGATTTASVPTFTQGAGRDSTDLQIRSLLYLFKRLRINRLAPFPNGNTLKYIDDKHWDDGISGADASVAKLDAMYNLPRFEQVLLLDPQRVLVDYTKNKFRMLCVLSEPPSAGFLRPLSPVKGLSTCEESESGFPLFRDYKDRRVSSFGFSLVPVARATTRRQISAELAQSLLYVEHFSYVSFAARFRVASNAVEKVLGSGPESSSVQLSEDTKAAVLREYLNALAFLVQLIRIYDQHVKMELSRPESPTKLESPKLESPPKLHSARSYSHLPPSPSRVLQPASPNQRALSPKKSLANIRQLASRPSISNFKANEIFNPVASPPLEKKSGSSGLPSGLGHAHSIDQSNLDCGLYGRDVRPEIWEKCKSSIREKLLRERRLLLGTD